MVNKNEKDFVHYTELNQNNLYKSAEVGKLCEGSLLQIESPQACREAHYLLKKTDPSFKDSMFVIRSGINNDLPSGCISDTLTHNHVVYWNDAERTVISADPKIRVICRTRKR